MVRTSGSLPMELYNAWWAIPLSYTNNPLDDFIYYPPMCNTCSKKCALPLPEPLGFDYPELNTRFHFFTLPNNVDGNDTVHMMQRDTTLYDI